jgi:hypothetical protein
MTIDLIMEELLRSYLGFVEVNGQYSDRLKEFPVSLCEDPRSGLCAVETGQIPIWN